MTWDPSWPHPSSLRCEEGCHDIPGALCSCGHCGCQGCPCAGDPPTLIEADFDEFEAKIAEHLRQNLPEGTRLVIFSADSSSTLDA